MPFATAGDCYSAARCPQVRTTAAEGKLLNCQSRKSTSVLVGHSVNDLSDLKQIVINFTSMLFLRHYDM